MKPKSTACTAEIISYGGWRNCIRLSDGRTELVATTDVGPRVIRFGFIGGPNLLKEYPEQLGRRGGKKWRIYGGHRLWTAPEDRRRTYTPDNDPVEWTWTRNILRLRTKADPQFGLAKELRIAYAADGSVRLDHRIRNQGKRPIALAPWTLTVMAPGGEAIFPQEPYATHPDALLPVRPLVLWAYTKMDDPRWTWGENEIRLRQDPKAKDAQKVGFFSTRGWMAYRLNRQVFIKRHACATGATHPDMGCNVETFTNQDMLELETLGPLVNLKPGTHIEHSETWGLFNAGGRTGLRTLSPLVNKVANPA